MAKYRVTCYENRWYTQLPLSSKGFIADINISFCGRRRGAYKRVVRCPFRRFDSCCIPPEVGVHLLLRLCCHVTFLLTTLQFVVSLCLRSSLGTVKLFWPNLCYELSGSWESLFLSVIHIELICQLNLSHAASNILTFPIHCEPWSKHN